MANARGDKAQRSKTRNFEAGIFAAIAGNFPAMLESGLLRTWDVSLAHDSLKCLAFSVNLFYAGFPVGSLSLPIHTSDGPEARAGGKRYPEKVRPSYWSYHALTLTPWYFVSFSFLCFTTRRGWVPPGNRSLEDLKFGNWLDIDEDLVGEEKDYLDEDMERDQGQDKGSEPLKLELHPPDDLPHPADDSGLFSRLAYAIIKYFTTNTLEDILKFITDTEPQDAVFGEHLYMQRFAMYFLAQCSVRKEGWSESSQRQLLPTFMYFARSCAIVNRVRLAGRSLFISSQRLMFLRSLISASGF